MKKLILLALGLSALVIFISCSSNQNGDKKRDPFSGTDFDKISEIVDNSTYLMKQSISLKEETSEKYCTKSKHDIFEGKYDDNYNMEILDSKEMQQELVRIIGDAQTAQDLTQQIKTFFDANKDTDDVGDWGGVCRKNKNIYVLFGPKGPGVTMSIWKKKNNFEFFKNNGQISYFVVDGISWMSIFPEVFGDKSLIKIQGVDLPLYYWTFYMLDPKTMNTDIVEQCRLEFEYNNETSFVNSDKFELTCDKEYKR